MVDDGAAWKIIEYAGGFVASAAAATFTVWKVLNKRFCDLEVTVQLHKEEDVKVLTSHEAQLRNLSTVATAMSAHVDRNRTEIARLEAQGEEKMRILEDLKDGQGRLFAKIDTIMDTLANVLLKIGK